MSTSGDLLFLGGGSLLFHATAVVSLVFSPLFSDIGDAISMAGGATVLGILTDIGIIEICRSLNSKSKAQSEEYKDLQKEYDVLQRKHEENQSASSDLEWLRESFPSVADHLYKRKIAKWDEFYNYKKPADIRTVDSYESEIQYLKDKISKLEYELYEPTVKYVHAGKSSFEVFPLKKEKD